MKLKLTMRNVADAKPDAKPYEMRDTDTRGLLLRVQPSGVKAFIVEWSRGKRSTLGRFPTLTLEGARKRARKAMTEVDTLGAPAAVIEAAKPVAGKVETFGDFMALYRPHLEATAKAGKATADCIEKQFGYLYGDKLDSIERVTFDQFKAKRLKAGLHPSTVNRDLDRIKAALSKAVEWKLLTVNPLLGLKRIKRDIEERVRYLSPREEKALRKALESREARFKARRLSGIAWRNERGREPLSPIQGYTDHLMPMTLLAVNTGMRRGEITQLTWADVDLRAKRVTVRAGYAKSGKARHIPLNSEAVAVLKQWKKQEPEGRLFKLECTAKSWGRLMEKAKLEDFRFHDLRHTFASKLVMAGIDLNTVRELLGHGDIKMTLRYAHLAPEHKAAAVEVLVG
ncbi:tyrosine-type recombinase/integrase [Rhodanobacter sp. FW102-FHT14D06]|uniref:Tyrosine-type recombinase/integrase n=2 Tax=unclassified Rhodanobacter TaxID=2621553 RepID=A0AB74V0R5_9GAMM